MCIKGSPLLTPFKGVKVGVFDVYAQIHRLGSTNASLKLKGIDGEFYQLWII